MAVAVAVSVCVGVIIDVVPVTVIEGMTDVVVKVGVADGGTSDDASVGDGLNSRVEVTVGLSFVDRISGVLDGSGGSSGG